MPETASSAALGEHVRETIAAEIEMVDVLVVTDAGELRAHHEAGRMPGARLAVVTDPAAPLTETDKLLLEIAPRRQSGAHLVHADRSRPSRSQRDGADAEAAPAERRPRAAHNRPSPARLATDSRPVYGLGERRPHHVSAGREEGPA